MTNKPHEYAYQSGESLCAQMDREYQEMVDRDREAKDNNTLIGRYLKERAADGHAFYEIVDENDQGLVIEPLDIYDGYTVPMYEGMKDCFPRHYAAQNIEARESVDGLFDK